MKAVLLLAYGLVLLAGAASIALGQAGPKPVWSLDLQQRLGLESFHREFGPAWTSQHDVVFLSPQRVLLYQVNKLREPARLAGRGASGGAGNFLLEARILGAGDGSLLGSGQLPTSAGFSKIIPTHDGKMIVRTGDSLLLCTEGFQPIASRTLPIQGEAPIDAWQIGLSPTGRELVLVHQQIKPSLLGPDRADGGWARSEIEVLDADTFKTLKAFSIPHALASWSAGKGVLLTANPAPASGAPHFGLLNYSGKWTSLEFEAGDCAYHLDGFEHGYMATYGCGKITVFGAHAEKVFSREVSKNKSVGSVRLSGQYLAVEIAREVQGVIPGTNFPIVMPISERLEVFDIQAGKKLLSLPAHNESLDYEISAEGNLVVVDGTSIALYRVGKFEKEADR